MILDRFFKILLTLILSVSFTLPADEDLLADKDVHRIMQQILDKHMAKHAVTDEIIRNSFKGYIEQFDPQKIYLLNSEVAPYLNMSDAQVKKILEQYQNNDLSSYRDLNNIILASIKRAQANRSQIEKGSLSEITPKIATTPLTYASFASSAAELKQRQKEQFVRFIAAEQRRYGSSYVHNSYPKLIEYYDKKQLQFENQYIPMTARGTVMSAEEQEHQFLIHVLKALSRTLDAHTTVMDSTEAYDMRVRLNKGFEGIGVDVAERADGFVVTSLSKDGPAMRSGKIKIGDRILEIDNKSVNGLDHTTVQEQLRGHSGTVIALLVQREGLPQPFRITLTRETIVINEGRVQVSYENFGNGIIGKIKLDSFYQGPNGISSVNDVKKAIQELDAKGNLRGLILDLRENTGGFLSEAIKVAGLFITNGVVVISKYNNGEEKFYRDMDNTVAYDGPLVILTSRATASAAEIVAQALQDYGVAVIVGDEQTYGKGTIQSQTVTRDDGSGSYFKVTVGQYYTVSGKTPQIQGVKADIVVPGRFSQLMLGEEYLDGPEKNMKHKNIPAAYKDSLEDIQPALKNWYMRYYMPTLQPPRHQWKGVIPKLRQNSQYRIDKNKNYQMFLKTLRGETIKADNFDEAEADDYGRVKHNNFGQDDLQMQEAVNIVKDMIFLQPQAEKQARLEETVKG